MNPPSYPEDLHPVQKWQAIRHYRNHLLAKTDWAFLSDSSATTAVKTGLKAKRKALRDLPKTFAQNPNDIQWSNFQ